MLTLRHRARPHRQMSKLPFLLYVLLQIQAVATMAEAARLMEKEQ